MQDKICLLYISDAADDLTRVDLGGRRISQKQKQNKDAKRGRTRSRQSGEKYKARRLD